MKVRWGRLSNTGLQFDLKTQMTSRTTEYRPIKDNSRWSCRHTHALEEEPIEPATQRNPNFYAQHPSCLPDRSSNCAIQEKVS
jgi:hypothetical protein